MKLNQIRQAHIEHGHHEQAARITQYLRSRFPALTVSEPEDAEAGRYVAVYVTLVPDVVRMMIQLKDGDQNHHVYQLRGVAEAVEAGVKFVEFITQEHPGLLILNSGSNRPYARVPSWQDLFTPNEDYETIAQNVLVGLAFIAKLPNLQWCK